MNFVKAVFLGIIQGVTEWLPISSTGHLLLFDAWFPLAVSPACRELLMVLIQLASILAVIILFRHRLWPFSPRLSGDQRWRVWRLWGRVALASVPVAVIGFLVDDLVEEHLETPRVIAIALLAYGVAYILFERFHRSPASVLSVDDISPRQALAIGLCESLALVPGTSRSGSTIIGSLAIGLDRPTASEFSFFLAIPAMAGASLLKLCKVGTALPAGEWGVIGVSSLVSFLVSLVAIKGMMAYVRRHTFAAFGWYRVALAVVVLAYFR